MTPTPKAILVPTDFSPASDSALDLARELAGPFDAEIHLLHVRTLVDSPVVSSDDLGEVEKILAPSDALAKQALEEAVTGTSVPVHCLIKRGITPVAAILDSVAEQRCDLVVMGTQGRRGLKGMFLGSVAREVIRRSPVPVLTTRAETDREFPPKRILVAYDTSEHSLEAVIMAAGWASRLSSRVTLLHVLEPIVYPDFYFRDTPRDDQKKHTVRLCHESLARIGDKHLADVEHETRVIYAGPSEGIARHALSEGFDLVVLATRGLSGLSHALFGSVADRVTQLSEVPVLTVRGFSSTPETAGKKSKKIAKHARRQTTDPARPSPFTVDRLPGMTVVRLHQRDSLAGSDLRYISGLWDFMERESRDPNPVTVVLTPPGLLDPTNLERLLGSPSDWDGPTATEISTRIIREENVIQRLIRTIRGLRSFVVGVAGGKVALQLAAPLLACDYRIIGPETVFVNTMKNYPRAPLGCVPLLLTTIVGGATATRILLDSPSLSAEQAFELGLVNHVADPGCLEEDSLQIADRLCSFHPAVLSALKSAAAASNEDAGNYFRQESALVEGLAYPAWSQDRRMGC